MTFVIEPTDPQGADALGLLREAAIDARARAEDGGSNRLNTTDCRNRPRSRGPLSQVWFPGKVSVNCILALNGFGVSKFFEGGGLTRP